MRSHRHSARAWVAGLLGLVLTATIAVGAEPANGLSAGESIYRRGVTASGQPLIGSRVDAPSVEGASAACINCHRRSGLGSIEGRIRVPPITGRYLFERGTARASQAPLPYVESARTDHPPHSDESLARAIREGVDLDGRPMNYLMPRYALGDQDLASLVAYLRALDVRRVPGLVGTELHIATILTPDSDPATRAAVLDVLNHFIADRNGAQRQPPPGLVTSGKTTYSKMMLRLSWQLRLHVWELTGPEATWAAQLARRLAAEPVFAVLSGLGGRHWAPVAAFCEQAQLPCLFPNVEAPPADADRDFYTLYLSPGVRVEARLLAAELSGHAAAGPAKAPFARVRQVYRAGDVGEAAAEELTARLTEHNIAVANKVVAGDGMTGIEAALRDPGSDEALVLWLRPDDLRQLPGAPAQSTYVSGLMGGLERMPLPAAWHSRAQLTYPVDLPERRRVRVDFALGWFRIRRIPIVNERIQADTYLACGIFSETLRNMIDAIFRDYLIERIEDGLEHRIVTGYYPRLTLGTGQRFGSKGAFLVRFASEQGPALVVERDWRSF